MFGGNVGVLKYGSAIDTSGFLAGLARLRSLGVGAGAQIAASLAGFGAVAGLGASARVAIDMEKSIAGLGKASDLSGQELAGMKAGLQGLSTSLSGVKLEDLVAIATTGAKMGIASGDLLKYTEGVAKVSTAIDDLPAGEIADQIGKLNTIFKLGVDGTLQFGSAIDKLADSGVSSASGILGVSQRISGSAVAAKLTAQETVALSAALLDTGTHSELAATSLQRLIAGLNDADSHAGFAKTIGVSAEEFAAMVRDKPIVAIQRFLGALKGLDAAGQQNALKSIGVDGLQGAGEIMKLAQVSGTLGTYIGYANAEFRSLDQIQMSYNKTAGLTSSLLVVAGNRARIIADTLGSALLPAINAALGGLGAAIAPVGVFLADMIGLLTQIPANFEAAFGGPNPTMIGSVATLIGSGVVDALSLAGFVLRNFGDLFSIAFVSASLQAGTFIENFGRIAAYVGGDWLRAMMQPIAFLGEIIASLATTFWNFLKNPAQGFRFDFSGIGEEFAKFASAAPALATTPATSPEIEAIQKRIADRESAFAAKGEGFKLPEAPAAATTAPGAPGARPPGATPVGEKVPEVKFAGAATLASADAYRTISAALAGGPGTDAEIPKKSYETHRKQLAEARRQTRALDRVARATEANRLDVVTV